MSIVMGPFQIRAQDADNNVGEYTSTFYLFPNAPLEIAVDAGVAAGDLTIVGIDEDYSGWPGHNPERPLRARTLGYRVDREPERASYRAYELVDGTLYVAITRQLVHPTGSKTIGRLDWSEDGTAVCSIRGVQLQDGRFEDLRAVWNAMRFIGGLKLVTRGRKTGDGATWPAGVEHFLDDLWTTLEKRQKSTGKLWGHDILSRDFRTSMEGHPSERTLRDWLRDAGLRVQDVESGKVNRENYSQFVAERGPYTGR